MKTIKSDRERYLVLDLLRGLAVFLMILAHNVYFLHNRSSSLLVNLEKMGNTFCFSAFLLVSAATTYIAYFQNMDDVTAKNRLLKRLWVILLAYYSLAFFVESSHLLTTYGLARLEIVVNILAFRHLPSYTEFIPPFFIFPIIVIFFHKHLKRMIARPLFAIIFALGIYLLGTFLHSLTLPSFFVPWQALFVGADGFFRFPVLYYFPVYIIGLLWGHALTTKDLFHKRQFATALAGASFLAIILIIGARLVFNLSLENLFLRWPPSIPFLLVGIGATFTTATILYLTKQLKDIKIPRDFLLVLGQNAFALFWTHIFLLKLYEMGSGEKVDSLPVFFILFAVVIILSLALATFIPFNRKLRLNFENKGHIEEKLEGDPLVQIGEEIVEEAEKDISKLEDYFYIHKRKGPAKLVKRRHILGASLTIALASFITIPTFVQEADNRARAEEVTAWWDNSYAYQRNIEVKNLETLSELQAGSVLTFSIDHKTLVAQKKSEATGSDLKVVYWNGRNFSKADSWAATPNTSSTKIYFNLPEKIRRSDSEKRLFLYHGNPLEDTVSGVKEATAIKSKYGIDLGEEKHHPNLLTLSRKWILKTELPKYKEDLVATASYSGSSQVTSASYEIEGGAKGTMDITRANVFETTIDAQNLQPGKYKIKVFFTTTDGNTETQSSGFVVSYPLYASWTLDWEGYDTSDVYLTAMEQISSQYSVPISHYFNPRLFITETVPEARKDKTLSWIKKRKSTFDEDVQLHLHMFDDFVRAAGIEPKEAPNWGDNGDGYGTLTTAYSEEETYQMVRKALSLFEENGLDKPDIFRGGGWFADLETLRAVERAGLKGDSSGRMAQFFKNQPLPWNLPAAAQPFYPSKDNQNATSGNHLNILEIPNNGADSYWFKASDMIARFDSVHTDNILDDKKQVTFLSHPHWFKEEEQAKMEAVFNHVSPHRYSSDMGPVIFVTAKDILNVWTQS